MEKKRIQADSWDDVRSVGESYSSDTDIDLFCEYLGKLRQLCWTVI